MQWPIPRFLSILFLLLLPWNGFSDELPPAQFSIFPMMFEVEVGPSPVNESIAVTNHKKRPTTFRVELYTWTLDDHHELKLIRSTPQTLDQWIVVNPVRFTMPPGGQQTVRFSIHPRVKPEPGEHRAILYLVEEPPAVDPGSGIQLLSRFGISIYGYVQPVNHAARLLDLSYSQSTGIISAQVLNTGNVHARLRGKYVIWKKGSFRGLSSTKRLLETIEPGKEPEGYVASGIIPGNPVLAGTTMRYSMKAPLPRQGGGPYVVAIIGELDGKPLEKVLE